MVRCSCCLASDTVTSVALPIMLRTAALTLSLSASLASCYPTLPAGPVVKIRNGSYVGVHSEEYKQDFFLGVPFAQPPVGNLRYRVPASLNETWDDIRPATTNPPEVRVQNIPGLARRTDKSKVLWIRLRSVELSYL
jgi:hypothetical protein